MKYYYARVSTKDQNLSRQFEDVKEQNIPEENVFADKMSGKNFERTEYQKLLDTVKEGDVIYCHSIDRLGRSYDQILKEWKHITEDLKVDIVILDMPLLDTTKGEDDLTGKLIKDIVLQLLSYVAETERRMILQRQKEGIIVAKAAGKFKKKDIDMELFAELQNEVYIHKTMTVVEACKRLDITKRTWYDKINGRKGA